MIPDSPKGPESEAGPLCNCAPCQREAAAKNVPIPYLRRQVAELVFDALEESQRSRGVLPIHNKTDVDAAAAAVVALVAPEMERLTAEVERLRALSDERHEIIQGWTRYKARTNEQKRAWLAEVTSLREQLAAQQRVWAPEDPTDESARLANALRFVGVVDPDDDCMSVFDTTGEGVKHWVPVDAIALRMLEHMSGVSSSEVEAPQPQPVQHLVQITPLDEGYEAWCPTCRTGTTGCKHDVRFWKDQHEADTLRPTLTNESFISSQDEGRPSGSERLAPRPCACAACTPDEDPWRVIMHLCPQCGNKRCPGAKDHRQTCSGSNEPHQPGSLYDFSYNRRLGQCDTEGCLRRRKDGCTTCEVHADDGTAESLKPEQDAAQAARSEATLKKSCRIDGCRNEPGYYGWCPEHSCGAHPDGNLAAGSCQFGQDAPHHVHADRTMVWQDSPYPSLRKEGEDQ